LPTHWIEPSVRTRRKPMSLEYSRSGSSVPSASCCRSCEWSAWKHVSALCRAPIVACSRSRAFGRRPPSARLPDSQQHTFFNRSPA
jgi:hypothetical protein